MKAGWGLILLGAFMAVSAAWGSGDRVGDLLFDLEVGKPDVRLAAVRSLGNAHDSRALEPLLEVARNISEKADLREEAILALGKLGYREAVPVLRDIALNPRDKDEVRIAAIEMAGRLDKRGSVRELAERFEDRRDDDDVRAAILGYLDRSESLLALPSLLLVAENPRDDDDIRSAALDLAVRLDRSRLENTLENIILARQDDRDVRRRALELAAEDPGPLIPALIDVVADTGDRDEIRLAALAALIAAADPRADEAVLIIAGNGRDDWEVRSRSLDYFRARRPAGWLEAVSSLAADPKAKDALRVRAFGILAELENGRAVEEALGIVSVESEDDEVQAAAAAYLGVVGDRSACQGLLNVLQQPARSGFLGLFRGGPSPGFQAACIRSLGRLGCTEARDVIDYLSRRAEDIEVKKAAREALGEL